MYMPSKITLHTYKHDNNNKYKNSHVSKPHVNKLLHDKSQSNTHQNKEKSKSKAKVNTTKKIQKISPKPMPKIKDYKKKKNVILFTFQIKNLIRTFSQPTKNFLQPTRDMFRNMFEMAQLTHHTSNITLSFDH
jgi:hypothetical protein